MDKRTILVKIKTKNYSTEIIANKKRVIIVATDNCIKGVMYKKLDWLKTKLKREGILEEWKEELE